MDFLIDTVYPFFEQNLALSEPAGMAITIASVLVMLWFLKTYIQIVLGFGDTLYKQIDHYSTVFFKLKLEDMFDMYLSSIMPVLSTVWLFLYYGQKGFRTTFAGILDLWLLITLWITPYNYYQVNWGSVLDVIKYQFMLNGAELSLVIMSLVPFLNLVTNIVLLILIKILEAKIELALDDVFSFGGRRP